jgi:hypothetical protein
VIDTDRMSRRLLRGHYEKVSQRLLRGQPKAKKYCRVENGRLECGTQSLHRTPQSLKWRLFWRIKNVRRNTHDLNFWRW